MLVNVLHSNKKKRSHFFKKEGSWGTAQHIGAFQNFRFLSQKLLIRTFICSWVWVQSHLTKGKLRDLPLDIKIFSVSIGVVAEVFLVLNGIWRTFSEIHHFYQKLPPLNHRSNKEVTGMTLWWFQDQDQHIGNVTFLIIYLFNIWHVIETTWNFFDLWLLYHKLDNHFLTVDLDQHTIILSFAIEDCFSFDLSTVTPDDCNMTFNQKFLNTPKEPDK